MSRVSGAHRQLRTVYAVPASQVARLPEAQRNALAIMREVGRDPAELARLKQIIGVGNPKGAPSNEQHIGVHGAKKFAQWAQEHGIPLTNDGVRRFKAEHHLSHGAAIGPTTAAAVLKEVKGGGGRMPSNEAAKYDFYKKMITDRGYRFDAGANQMNLVGLRGYSDGKTNSNGFNRYNDTIAVVWRDANGTKHVRELDGTVDPGVKRNDRRDGVAHIDEGQYRYVRGTHRGRPALNSVGAVRVNRDLNHDGQISQAEERLSRQRGYSSSSINIHWAGSGSTVGPWSEGCQAIKGGYDHFQRFFMSLARKDPDAAMSYTVLRASDVRGLG